MARSLLSDLEVARLRMPEASDTSRVRRLARELVEEWELQPPVDLELVASLRDIEDIEYVDLPWAACLVQRHDQTLIKIRAGDRPRRQRFSLAHEIGHTFLPGYTLAPQYRCDPSPRPTRRRDLIEQLSDVAASELLLPHRTVQQELNTAGCTLDTAVTVADICDASLEAAARRVVDVTDDAALLCLELTTAPRQPAADPRLRLRYAYTRGNWPYLPPWKSLSDEHPLQACLQGEIVDTISPLSDLNLALDAPARITAQYAPWRDNDGDLHHRVLAIAVPA